MMRSVTRLGKDFYQVSEESASPNFYQVSEESASPTSKWWTAHYSSVNETWNIQNRRGAQVKSDGQLGQRIIKQITAVFNV